MKIQNLNEEEKEEGIILHSLILAARKSYSITKTELFANALIEISQLAKKFGFKRASRSKVRSNSKDADFLLKQFNSDMTQAFQEYKFEDFLKQTTLEYWAEYIFLFRDLLTENKIKHIGYHPINIFAQTEPLEFPYVLMPKPNSVIKFPRKGYAGRKGYKEESFKKHIDRYFKKSYQVFDDRSLLVKKSTKPFEPDFTLIDERDGINIFLDIEIDEPYEGLNDVSKRQPIHFQNSDTIRNSSFKNRGWIVIRFAEIQIHQNPDSCCKFIADVLKSINPNYIIPESLSKQNLITPVSQWSKSTANEWSKNKYRESYLGIEKFGFSPIESSSIDVEETELDPKIEELVIDDLVPENVDVTPTRNILSDEEKIKLAIKENTYLKLFMNQETTILKPKTFVNNDIMGCCYVKNKNRTFVFKEILDLEIKKSYFTTQVEGFEKIKNVISIAIKNNKKIRIIYTNAPMHGATKSVRTISNIELAINVMAAEHIEAFNLNNNYIRAFCNKRNEQRVFKISRISKIEILDL